MPLHPICPVLELPPGSRKIVTVCRMEIGVFNVAGTFYAFRNICPHAGAPVCVGKISGTTLPSAVYEYEYGRQGTILRCPWHGWEFDLKTGEHLVDAETRLKKYPVVLAPKEETNENLESFSLEVQDGIVHISLPG